MEKINMNHKEQEQIKVFEQVEQGKMTKIAASRRLGITDRWVRTKFKRYKINGDIGVCAPIEKERVINA